MKHFLRIIIQTPMLIIFAFVAIFFGSVAIGKDAELDEYAVVSVIGLDPGEKEEEVAVSILAFVPITDQTFAEKYKVITATGKSVAQALDYTGLKLGKLVGLSHVKTVVVNQKLFENDVSLELDYLARDKTLPSSTTLICTDAPAKKFLENVQALNTNNSIKIEDLIEYNSKYIYSVESSFESFYTGLYSPSGASLVSFLTLSEESGAGLAESSGSESASGGGSESGSSESGSSADSKNNIVNPGDAILCKNGKFVKHLKKEELKKINFINGNFRLGSLVIQDFSDEHFTNATLTFDIYDDNVNVRAEMKNGVPIFYLDLKLYLQLSEIKNENALIKENVEIKNLSDEAIKAIEFKVKNSISEALTILRETKCDVIHAYTLLSNSNHQEFHKFLSLLDDPEDFLSYVVFKVSPQVYSS